MKRAKQFYRDNAPEGWQWVGYDSETMLHEFQTGNYKDGFKVVRCWDSEITDGSLKVLIRYSRTR